MDDFYGINLTGRGLRGVKGDVGDVNPQMPILVAEAEAARDEAEQAALEAAASAATAESAAGPTYADTAAGLAATSDGEAFAVDNGDGTVTVWLNDGGVAVEQRTLLTTEYAASDAGSSAIGTRQVFTESVLRTQRDKNNDFINLLDFGPLGSLSGDSDLLNKAIEAIYQERGGGTLWLPDDADIRLNGPVLWRTGVNLRGFGSQRPVLGAGKTTTRLISDSSDLVHHGYGAYLGGELSNLELISEIGGGHVFRSFEGQSRTNIHNVYLEQRNPDKSILSAVHPAVDGYYGNWWEDFYARYAAENTAPAFHIECANTINNNYFGKFRIDRPVISKSGTYAFDIHNTTASIAANSNQITQGTIQQPGGGGIRFRGLRESSIDHVGVWDLTTGSVNPIFYFGEGAAGQNTARCGMSHVLSNVRAHDPASVDVFIDSPNATSIHIDRSYIGRMDGADTAGAYQGPVCQQSVFLEVNDCSYTNYDAKDGYERVQPGALINRFKQAMGATGSNDGYFRWLINEVFAGGMRHDGAFIWGGSTTSPQAVLTNAGVWSANEYRDRVSQAKIMWGTGSPIGSVAAAVGSIYMRRDGATGETMYVKEGGGVSVSGWVAK